MVAVEAVCAIASFAIAVIAVNGIGEGLAPLATAPYFFDALIFSGFIIVGISAMGLYDSRQRYGFEGALARMVIGVGLAAVMIAVSDFLFTFIESQRIWELAFGISIVALGCTRYLFA